MFEKITQHEDNQPQKLSIENQPVETLVHQDTDTVVGDKMTPSGCSLE